MAYVACYNSLLIPASGGSTGGVPNIRQVLQAGNDAQGESIGDLNAIQATGVCTLHHVNTDQVVCSGDVSSDTFYSAGLATLHQVDTTQVICSGEVASATFYSTGLATLQSVSTDSISSASPLSITSPQTNLSDNVEVGGNLVVIGNCDLASAQLSDNLIVNGNCAIGGTLTTTGAYTPASIATNSFTLDGSPYPAFPQPDPAYGVGVVKIFANGSGLTTGDYPVGATPTILNDTPPAGVYMLKSELDIGNARGAGYVVKINVFYAGVLVGFDNIVVNAVTGIVTTCYPCVALFRSTGVGALTMRFDVIASSDAGTVGIALDSDVDLIRLF